MPPSVLQVRYEKLKEAYANINKMNKILLKEVSQSKNKRKAKMDIVNKSLQDINQNMQLSEQIIKQ